MVFFFNFNLLRLAEDVQSYSDSRKVKINDESLLKFARTSSEHDTSSISIFYSWLSSPIDGAFIFVNRL